MHPHLPKATVCGPNILLKVSFFYPQKYPNFDNKLYGDPVYNEVRRKKP